MKRFGICLVVVLVVLNLVAAGCATASAPAPAQPTAAPAKAADPAAAKAAEPTKAPTAAAAAKAAWPEKGKAITVIVPSAAGSPNDIWVRLVAAYMEKELGVPIQVAVKAGASGQIGMTELAKAKPDGYTLGANSLEQTIYTYLDKDRSAPYDQNGFSPIAVGLYEPFGLVVPGNSPYKTMKELIDVAKTSPGKIKMGDNGIGTPSHMAPLLLAQKAGVEFAQVHFTGSGEQVTAMLGGHIDAGSVLPSSSQAQFKSGDLRPLAVFDTQEIAEFPNTKTAQSMGYEVVMARTLGWDGPPGLPADIVQVIAAAMKKVDNDPEFLKKATEAGMIVRHMDMAEYKKHWSDSEASIKLLMPAIKSEQSKQPTPAPAPTK